MRPGSPSSTASTTRSSCGSRCDGCERWRPPRTRRWRLRSRLVAFRRGARVATGVDLPHRAQRGVARSCVSASGTSGCLARQPRHASGVADTGDRGRPVLRALSQLREDDREVLQLGPGRTCPGPRSARCSAAAPTTRPSGCTRRSNGSRSCSERGAAEPASGAGRRWARQPHRTGRRRGTDARTGRCGGAAGRPGTQSRRDGTVTRRVTR